MIQVIAKIELIPEKKTDYLEIMSTLVPLVRAEEGCLEYVPMIHFPTTIGRQEPLGPNVVMIVEKWESAEDLERHLIAQHMLDYRKATGEMIARSSLQILEPVFERNPESDD